MALALGLALSAPAALAAQAGTCVLEFPPNQTTRFTSQRTPSGGYNTFLGGGVLAVCRGQSLQLRADSAEYYQDSGVLFLLGNVHYTEPRTTVDADRMTYWTAEERLLAEGKVVASMPNGTRMTGPRAEYWRPVPRVRTRSRMVATGRPTVQLVETDSAGRPGEPVQVIANQVVTEADSLVYASGRVEITRPDVVATGDSAYMDSGREFARLMRSPRIEGRGERPFTLSGAVIDLFSRERRLERVLSVTNARAVSEDITLAADTIDMRMSENRLQRAHAWGASRARATSPTNDIVADSIEVVMPAQRLREVRAIGGAFAQTEPDTTKIRNGERDWIRGDSLIARFDTLVAPSDTSSKPRVRELVAQGGASSLHQIPSNQGPDAAPSVNYVRGKTITIAFSDQQVRSVTVVEQAAGLYLEPARGGTAATREPPVTGDRP
jgi:lipopolysaccharide export system protein LptA